MCNFIWWYGLIFEPIFTAATKMVKSDPNINHLFPFTKDTQSKTLCIAFQSLYIGCWYLDKTNTLQKMYM